MADWLDVQRTHLWLEPPPPPRSIPPNTTPQHVFPCTVFHVSNVSLGHVKFFNCITSYERQFVTKKMCRGKRLRFTDHSSLFTFQCPHSTSTFTYSKKDTRQTFVFSFSPFFLFKGMFDFWFLLTFSFPFSFPFSLPPPSLPLPVPPCHSLSLTHLLTYSLTHSLSLTHLLTYSLTLLLSYSLTLSLSHLPGCTPGG